jgi:hypothetical protein
LSADSPITSPVPSGLETGRYCVLSTGHLSVATAELLDRWSKMPGHDRPINIAPNSYGWFVPTLEMEGEPFDALPVDLRAATQFARDRGFDYIRFDCDARTVSELATYDW